MLKVKIETYEDRASPDRTCLPERRVQTNLNLSFLSLYLRAPFGVGSEWRSAGLSHASARRYQSGTFRRRGTLLTLRYGTCRNILSENKESNEDKKKKSPGTASKAPSTVGLELVRQVRVHGATAR